MSDHIHGREPFNIDLLRDDLIATRDALLEAAEEIARECADCMCDEKHHHKRCWLCDECPEFRPREKLRAAIAQCRGEGPAT